jgi:mRNA interferase MazF
MDVVIERFTVALVALDPGVGAEMRKTRPCAIVSPDAMHKHLKTVVVVPMTSGRTGWPTRLPCVFAGIEGELALDQMRSVDRRRLVKSLGRLDGAAADRLVEALQTFFS